MYDHDKTIGAMMEQKVRCRDCATIFNATEFLFAPSPFDPEVELAACPHCRQCDEGFDRLCDEDGCVELACMGWPSWGTYRRSCSKHWSHDGTD
jgi:hypothetical protein